MVLKPRLVMANSIDRMFRAFSDRTRLRILYLLRGGECCVGDIGAILRIEQPSASRHLAYLRRAGLVSVRRSATWSYYRLTAAASSVHVKLLECLTCCVVDLPEVRADQRRAAEVRRLGGCCPEEPPSRTSRRPKPKVATSRNGCAIG